MSEEFEQQQLGQKGTFESARAQGKTTDKANNLIDTYGQSGTKTNSNVKSAGRSSGTIPKMDWRARIRPKKGGEDIAYGMSKKDGGDPGNSILKPLKERGGIVFPYTPNIFLQASVEYNEATFHGTNYPFYTYINSRPPVLPVQGQWTANTTEEAQYLLAVFHFLRTVTKGFYGDSSVQNNRFGTPPPVLIFEYLGEYGFNKVPVIIRSYNMQLPDGIDYIPVTYNGKTTYMPTETDIMIEMAPQYTYKKLRKTFDLGAFSSGKDYTKGFI
tara:strand:+ start:204 stop:1016 length:813 start_codon:yes stop_codon:yes gene_type:complete